MSATCDALVLPVLATEFTDVPPSYKSSVNLPTLWSKTHGKTTKAMETRVFHQEDGPMLSVVSLGKDATTPNAAREAGRKAIATGVKAARDSGARSIGIVTGKLEEHDAAVAANLAIFDFTLQTKEKDPLPSLECASAAPQSTSELGWKTGSLYAEGQNLARQIFCERAIKEFEGLNNVDIKVHDEAWATEKGMRTFLSVTRGTAEPAKFLEIHYKGATNSDVLHLGLVGKGVTFDSGGISIKPGANMKAMRGDMGGAATVLAALRTIAKLKLPINVVLATPLTENMPGGRATKPGDVVEVDNTDAEGRHALTYVSRDYKPRVLIDVATLTGAMDVALGQVFSGVFSTSDNLWSELYAAGEAEYDRFWRMPLDEEFGPQIYKSNADLCNTGGRSGGSCTAALFLKAFVEGIESIDGQDPKLQWAHIDIAGTMEATRAGPYQKTGMTGRGVRGLVEYARRLAKSMNSD
ncbi:putative cytosol aminopeptidase [Serendipita vermifera]|nr:putative cytosol aminopeptidase [Serendipita vermifera]